jgi:hypothetical protein
MVNPDSGIGVDDAVSVTAGRPLHFVGENPLRGIVGRA